MYKERPYCLSLAGFDPSGGAGVLADIKVFEQLKTYGLGIATALTYQNETSFEGVQWVDFDSIKKQLEPLSDYLVKAVKVGLIENMYVLQKLFELLKLYFPNAFIVWDPILKATAGFNFHANIKFSNDILNSVDLITPNLDEYETLKLQNEKRVNILLKGGHRKEQKGTDILFINGNRHEIIGEEFKNKNDKHGTGCILSSAIAANIALGECLIDACTSAKNYVERFIMSNNGRLGYHNI